MCSTPHIHHHSTCYLAAEKVTNKTNGIPGWSQVVSTSFNFTLANEIERCGGDRSDYSNTTPTLLQDYHQYCQSLGSFEKLEEITSDDCNLTQLRIPKLSLRPGHFLNPQIQSNHPSPPPFPITACNQTAGIRIRPARPVHLSFLSSSYNQLPAFYFFI